MIRIISACLVLFSSAAISLADEPTSQSTTAPYIRAIELTKQLASGPDEKFVDGDAPLDDQTAKFLERNAEIFALLHEGATSNQSIWDGEQDNMSKVLQPLNPMRDLANLGVLRARYLFKQNLPDHAIDQLIDVMALSRNVGRQSPYLVGYLVAVGIQQMTIQELAEVLPSLAPAQIVTLSNKLKQLPACAAFSDIMRSEQKYGATMLAKQMKPVDLVKFDLVKIEQDMAPFYDTAEKASDEIPPLSADQFKQRLVDTLSNIPDKNQSIGKALAQNLVTSFVPCYSIYRVAEVNLAMLNIGIAVVHDGPGAVQQSSDPFGKGPFEYEETTDGFEIHSALLDRSGKPVSMRFGK